jgi:hypothetical protein
MGLAAFNRMRRIQAEAKEEAAKASKESVEDPELEALRVKGKELGVRNWHNMGREKLLEKIEEAEVSANGGQTEKGNASGSETEEEQKEADPAVKADQE